MEPAVEVTSTGSRLEAYSLTLVVALDMLLRGSEYIIVSKRCRQRVLSPSSLSKPRRQSTQNLSVDLLEVTHGTQTFWSICVLQYSSIVCLLYSEGDDEVQSESEELDEDVCASDKEEHVWTVGLRISIESQIVRAHDHFMRVWMNGRRGFIERTEMGETEREGDGPQISKGIE